MDLEFVLNHIHSSYLQIFLSNDQADRYSFVKLDAYSSNQMAYQELALQVIAFAKNGQYLEYAHQSLQYF